MPVSSPRLSLLRGGCLLLAVWMPAGRVTAGQGGVGVGSSHPRAGGGGVRRTHPHGPNHPPIQKKRTSREKWDFE